jgi:DNA-binding MarR family transcriptional regulator
MSVTNPTAAALALALDRLRGRLRQEAGLGSSAWSRSHLAALNRIVRDGPITTSDLAAAEYMKPQSMSQTVTALEVRGLVQRTYDREDHRRRLLVATEEGRAVAESALTAREAWLASALENGLTEQERAALPTLIRLLGRLADWEAPPRRRRLSSGAPRQVRRD